MNPNESADQSELVKELIQETAEPATRVPSAIPGHPAFIARVPEEIKPAAFTARRPEEIKRTSPVATGTKIVKAAALALLLGLFCSHAFGSVYQLQLTNDTGATLTAELCAWLPNGHFTNGAPNTMLPGTNMLLLPTIHTGTTGGGGVTWPVGLMVLNSTNATALLVPFQNETNGAAGVNAVSDLYQVGYLQNSNSPLAFFDIYNDLSIPLTISFFAWQSDGRPTLSSTTNISPNGIAVILPGIQAAGLLVQHGLNATAAAVNYNSLSNYFGGNINASTLFNLGYTVNTNTWSSGVVQPTGTTGNTVTQTVVQAVPSPVSVYGGTNNPNGLYTASIGSMFNLFDGTGTNLIGQYVKSTTSGNNGWVLNSTGGGTNGASTNGLATIQYVQAATNTLAAPALTGIIPQASIPSSFNISGLTLSNALDSTVTPVVETNSGLTITGQVRASTFVGSGSGLTGLPASAVTNANGFWAAAPAGGGSGNVNSNAASTIFTGNITVYGVYNGNGSGLTSLLPSAITNAAGFWAAAPAGGGTGNVNSNAVGTIFSGGLNVAGLISGAGFTAFTNGLATIAYVQASTNGLATTAYVQASTNGVVAAANNLAAGAALTNVIARGSFTVTTGLAGTNASEFSINTNGDGVIGGVQLTNGNLSANNLILAPGGLLNITNIPPTTASSNTFSLTTFTNGMPPFSYRIGWSNTYLVIIMNSNAVTFMKQIFP
jgi:hypothetical protein